jgi:hypothetical protein
MKLTRAQAEAHQAKHGFAPKSPIASATIAPVARLAKPRMNGAESQYALLLEAMRRRGDIVSWSFEGITLRLADGCRYTPDFFVVINMNITKYYQVPRLRFIEVKGRHIWDDAKVKFKVAREQNPWAEWEMHQKTKEGWTRLL